MGIVWAAPYSHFEGGGGYGDETTEILGKHESE